MIYVIGPAESTVVKIGHTTLDPARRVAGLQTGNPERLVLRWSGEGDEKLEKHLHVVFRDYRVQGEWFDLAQLGDPVEAVRSEVRKAHERLAMGEGLLAASEPYRYPPPKYVWPEDDQSSAEVAWDPEVPESMRRGRVYIPPSWPHKQTWDGRPPIVDWLDPLVDGLTVPEKSIVRRSASGEDPKPGCIRVWKGRCRRPAGTTCEGC